MRCRRPPPRAAPGKPSTLPCPPLLPPLCPPFYSPLTSSCGASSGAPAQLAECLAAVAAAVASFKTAAAPFAIGAVPATLPESAVADCADPADAGWQCGRVVYVGDLDWFSHPTATRDGAPLNVSDDFVSFVLRSPAAGAISEESAPSTASVRVDNVSHCPLIAA